jgi:hypothetical protein
VSQPLELSAEAWALLGFIYRHTRGGPRPPSPESGFADAYQRLALKRLIYRSPERDAWVISELGELALRDRQENA